MFLSFCFGLVLAFVFLLPVVQQGVSLVVVIFGLSFFMSVIFGLCGYVWYGFSLFLIYVGSLLVMFGYVVAMIPNFLFKGGGGFLFVFLGVFLGRFSCVKLSFQEGVFDVGGLIYSERGFYILIGLGFVLLFTLVCVVKVCYFRRGALRPFSFN